MKTRKLILALFVITINVAVFSQTSKTDKMIVRLTEIEVYPERLEEYLPILKKESAISLQLEPGVISIFSMFVEGEPDKIRILEIYASQQAYESHLQTTHFKEYKTLTMEMVKSLKLVDMGVVDKEMMPSIFKKLN